MSRENELVELVDAHGTSLGSSTVVDAHAMPGRWHRAFSVLLFDEAGRTLLQQRAAAKTRFPLIWANTCCGHPRPGETPIVAAQRRLGEELGLRGVDLVEVGVHTYQAGDPTTGRVEREYDHVLVGRVVVDADVHPDPDEVAATRWEPAGSLLSRLTGADPADGSASGYAPWLSGVLDIALRAGTPSA